MSKESNIAQRVFALQTSVYLIQNPSQYQLLILNQLAREQLQEELENKTYFDKENEVITWDGFLEQPCDYKTYLLSPRWKRIRQLLLPKKCKECNKPARQLHHICYNNLGLPEELNDIIPLCKKCHEKKHLMEGLNGVADTETITNN